MVPCKCTSKKDTVSLCCSWQEMALYDLPTSIDFVLNKTKTKSIPYIGHSQGNLMAFVHEALTKNSKVSTATFSCLELQTSVAIFGNTNNRIYCCM